MTHKRKVRHPYQILEASEMVIGQHYAFVHAYSDGKCFVSHHIMGGVIDDTYAAAFDLGYDLAVGNPRVEMLIADPPTSSPTTRWAADADDVRTAALRLGYDLDSGETAGRDVRCPGQTVVTIHMDGWWYGAAPENAPTLIYWGGAVINLSWDLLVTYLGPEEKDLDGSHCIVVPSQRWKDDPRVHVASWNNPNGVIERAMLAESAAEWEHRMRAKTHAAMAKMLGF